MRRTILRAACLLLLVLAFWWWWRRDAVDPDFVIALSADRTSVGPLGYVHIAAAIDPALHQPRFVWKASGGHLRGRGAHVTWVGSRMADEYTVTVEVKVGRVIHEQSIVLSVVEYDLTPRPEARSNRGEENGYVVESVELEKNEICLNEDVRVRIRAHDPEGASQWLSASGMFGGGALEGTLESIGRLTPAYFNRFREEIDRGEAPFFWANVIDTRTGTVVARVEKGIVVKNCEVPGQGLGVSCGPMPGEKETRCTASLGGDPMKVEQIANEKKARGERVLPIRYEWELDDGRTLTTDGNIVRFERPLEIQDKAECSHEVKARAFFDTGESIEGRGMYTHSNQQWISRESTGIAYLVVHFAGFPTRVGDEHATRATLINPYDEEADLERVHLTLMPCADPAAVPSSAPPTPESVKREERDVAAASIVGRPTLGPGERVDFVWKMPVNKEVCSISARIRGTMKESGLPAEALMQMPTRPPDARLSGATKAYVMNALEVLSRRRGERVRGITEDELADLVDEGLIPDPPEDWHRMKNGFYDKHVTTTRP